MSDLYVGVMSGTSLDGIDAVVLDFSFSPPRLVGSQFEEYTPTLKEACLALNHAGPDELHRIRLLAQELSRAYARTVGLLLDSLGLTPSNIAAIGCHGQTVRHRPDLGYSVQLVDAALLAELTGITAIVDFRARDLAAGGQGAPLVPAFHSMWFHSSGESRAIVNIGGIANVTGLARDGSVRGFDTGPGNGLMDEWIRQCSGRSYDAGGAFAASGTVRQDLLEQMVADPYFSSEPPKSTGREYFSAYWLRQMLLRLSPDKPNPADVQRTLAELTAQTIASAIGRWLGDAKSVFVCGGGAHNRFLIDRLAAHLGDDTHTALTSELGLDPDWVEAAAFAWLARCCLRGAPGNVPGVTGAKGPRVLGAVYPA